MSYKRQYQTDNIIRLADGAVIPNNPTLSAYAEYLEWAATNETLAATPPPPPSAEELQNAADIQAAKVYAKLNALKGMSPAQVQAWVAANVTNLAQAQDAIATLGIAVSILARRL